MFVEIINVYNKATDKNESQYVGQGFFIPDFALKNNAPLIMTHMGNSEKIDTQEVVRNVIAITVNHEHFYELNTNVKVYNVKEKL